MRAAFFHNRPKLEFQKDPHKEKVPQLDPLGERPPALSIAPIPSYAKYDKPLPELSARPLPRIEQPPVLELSNSSTAASSSSTPTWSNNPILPAPRPASIQQTTQSTTLYSPSNSSPIVNSTSWSKFAEPDLVANLNSRERTRQEALYEIVSSEERYVNDLARMKEAYIDPLLHPFSSTSASPRSSAHSTGASPSGSKNHDEGFSCDLPVASRFLYSPLTSQPTTPEISNHDIDNDLAKSFSLKKNANRNRLLSPYLTTDSAQSPTKGIIQTQGTRMLRWAQKSPTHEPLALPDAIPLHQLPEDLRICLEVIENNLLEGHARLSEAFKKRYEEQYPLVRSLADVFALSSHILTSYSTYVLHLERALEQVENALRYANGLGHKPSKKQEGDQLFKVCTYIQLLEQNAAEKGVTGLAISLSMPFQRFLVYPVMFQNLLFYTDPSTLEYERTLQMVVEVETTVRNITDEKIQKEERDKTRDVLERIDGLGKVRQLAAPKPSRILVEERMFLQVEPGANWGRADDKPSFKRLSDVLQPGSDGIGGKKDLWLVVFNDVVLRCQRTGTTSLPIGGASHRRTNSMPEIQGQSKFAPTGRRDPHVKPRNLYKFLKIETWDIGNVVQPREGIVAMDEVARSRKFSTSAQLFRSDEDEKDDDSDDSDKSFLNWGPNRQKQFISGPRRVFLAQKSVGKRHALDIATDIRSYSPMPNSAPVYL